jgi:hypothetical protein
MSDKLLDKYGFNSEYITPEDKNEIRLLVKVLKSIDKEVSKYKYNDICICDILKSSDIGFKVCGNQCNIACTGLKAKLLDRWIR